METGHDTCGRVKPGAGFGAGLGDACMAWTRISVALALLMTVCACMAERGYTRLHGEWDLNPMSECMRARWHRRLAAYGVGTITPVPLCERSSAFAMHVHVE